MSLEKENISRRGFGKLAASLTAHALLIPSLAFGQKNTTTQGVPAWEFLQPGDTIDVIAPSSPVDNPKDRYQRIREYFSKTPFKINIPDDLIDPTIPLDAANTIEKRVSFIQQAFASDSKAIWAIGGGGWGTSILEKLAAALPKPQKIKPILGYSDVSALHVLANQYWGFPSIHSVVLGINADISPGFNKNGLSETMAVLSGSMPELTYDLTPLNSTAKNLNVLNTKIVGGNSLLIAALNGSENFTLNTKGKILFLESIADGPGRFSRKLIGMAYSKIIREADGIIFGDIIRQGGHDNSPEVETQFRYVIQRFADEFAPDKVVCKAENLFGHGTRNLPLPLNTHAQLLGYGDKISLSVSANRV